MSFLSGAMRLLSLALILVCLPLDAAFAEAQNSQAIIEEMVVDYGAYGSAAEAQIDGLLEELETLDPTAAAKWTRVMSLWRSVQTAHEVHSDVLPDGLDDTDALCLVVLGFQLNPDAQRRSRQKRARTGLAWKRRNGPRGLRGLL